jgi:hypothetical protein
MAPAVRAEREAFVKAHIFEKTGAIARARVRGDMSQITTTVEGIRMFVVAWVDTKPVHLISTIASSKGVCQRRVKVNGVWGIHDIPRPTQIGQYNHGMKGTDLGDQKTSYYVPLMKGNSWIPRVLTDLMQRMVVNAQILFKKSVKSNLNTRQFQRAIILGLCEAHLKDLGNQEPTDPLPIAKKRTRQDWELDPLRPGCRGRAGGQLHTIKIVQISEDRAHNQDSKVRRGDCKICGKKCNTLCVACGVHLCLNVAQESDKSCDEIFHCDRRFPPPTPLMKNKNSANRVN